MRERYRVPLATLMTYGQGVLALNRLARVLHHVAHDSGMVVVAPAALDVDNFTDIELDVIDEVPVP